MDINYWRVCQFGPKYFKRNVIDDFNITKTRRTTNNHLFDLCISSQSRCDLYIITFDRTDSENNI